MLLVQKQTAIPLHNKDRVRKLICLDFSTLLIVKAKSMILYSFQLNSQLFIACVQDWEKDQAWVQQKIQEQISIIEAYYHKKLKKIFLLLSRSQKVKHQKWILAETKIMNNKLTTPLILQDYLKSITKYDQLQLKPRVITFPYSDYYVFLREFYNDSMFLIYKGDENMVKDGFFIKQENMGAFDERNILVSYRAQFKNFIGFKLYDLVNSNKNLVAQSFEISNNRGGVIQSIKRVDKKNNPMQKEQSSQYFQSSIALIAVNRREKQISYLLFNCATKQLMYNLPNISDSIILMYFTQISEYDYENGDYNGKIWALQRKGHQTIVTYQNFKKSLGQKMADTLIYKTNENLQQWQISKLSSKQFFIINYSQPVQQQDKIICKFYRSYDREEGVMSLCDSLGLYDGLYQDIFQIMGLKKNNHQDL